jgi:hypothetical protein
MLFDRVASLVIGQSGGTGKELSGLRFAFDIEKGATDTPNKCNLHIWNLTASTRALLDEVGAVVILKAGYARDVGALTIFTGTITRATTLIDGPDRITELELRDGFFEWRDTKASLSFPAGSSAKAALAAIAAKFDLTLRPIPSDIADRQYPTGFAFAGRAREALAKVCGFLGAEWSIQNRELQVVAKGGVYRKQAIVLSSNSGLIGSPEPETKTMTDEAAAKEGITAGQTGVTQTIKAGKAAKRLKSGKMGKAGKAQVKLHVQGYTANSLLQPTVEPGGYVQLKTADVAGEFFRVERVRHSGDTHGDNWFSELTLRYAS